MNSIIRWGQMRIFRRKKKKQYPTEMRLWVNGKEIENPLMVEILNDTPHFEGSRIACVWTSEPRRELLEIRSFDLLRDSNSEFRSVCSVCGEPIRERLCCWREFAMLAPPPCSDLNPHFGRLYHDDCIVKITLADLDDHLIFYMCSLKKASLLDLEVLKTESSKGM